MLGTLEIIFEAKNPQEFGDIETLRKEFSSWRECFGDENYNFILNHFDPILSTYVPLIKEKVICYKRTKEYIFLFYRDSGNTLTALFAPLGNSEFMDYLTLANAYLNYLSKTLRKSIRNKLFRTRYKDVICIIRPKDYREIHLLYEPRRKRLLNLLIGPPIISAVVTTTVSLYIYFINYSRQDEIMSNCFRAFSISSITSLGVSIVSSVIVLFLIYGIRKPKEFYQDSNKIK